MGVKEKKQAVPKAPKAEAPAVRKPRDIPTPALSPAPPKRKMDNAFAGDDFPVSVEHVRLRINLRSFAGHRPLGLSGASSLMWSLKVKYLLLKWQG